MGLGRLRDLVGPTKHKNKNVGSLPSTILVKFSKWRWMCTWLGFFKHLQICGSKGFGSHSFCSLHPLTDISNYVFYFEPSFFHIYAKSALFFRYSFPLNKTSIFHVLTWTETGIMLTVPTLDFYTELVSRTYFNN